MEKADRYCRVKTTAKEPFYRSRLTDNFVMLVLFLRAFFFFQPRRRLTPLPRMSRAYFCVRHDLGFSSHPLGCMYTHLSENIEAITAPMSCAIMPKDCTSTPALKYGGHHSPDTLSHDDERLYTHLSENIEAITAPIPCPMMTKDCIHTCLKT